MHMKRTSDLFVSCQKADDSSPTMSFTSHLWVMLIDHLLKCTADRHFWSFLNSVTWHPNPLHAVWLVCRVEVREESRTVLLFLAQFFSLYTLNYLQHISVHNQHRETRTIISIQKTIFYRRCISIHLLNAQIAFHSASETASVRYEHFIFSVVAHILYKPLTF